MTQTTLPGRAGVFSRRSMFAFSNEEFGGVKPKMHRTSSGGLVVEGVPVFRSGTFRDSRGVQATWEDIQIRQMVENYDYLKSKKILLEVPIRDGHPGWIVNGAPGMGQVIGWHSNLYSKKLEAPHDKQEYLYVLGDFEVTDPAAAEKVENGTFRNRSAEIGAYVTNNEAEFYPVYLGVAYVDLPAVEGLRFSGHSQAQDPAGQQFFVFLDGFNFSQPKESGVTQSIMPAVQAAAPPAAPAAQAAPAPAAQAFSFFVNGAPTVDFTAVQTHITMLEKFRADTTEANRVAFVAGLSTSGRILATQVEATEAFAKSLNDEQYVAWSKTWEGAQSSPLVGQHAAGTPSAGGVAPQAPGGMAPQTATPAAADQKFADDEAIVRMHTMAGTPADKIKLSPAYKRLAAANRAPEL